MGIEDAPLVEIESAHCLECGETIAAQEFSNGQSGDWPIIIEGIAIAKPRVHGGCGGRVELTGVRPAWHFCDDNCECGLGGLPERV